MAYSKIASSLALVALTVACNQAANYESTYKKEEQQAAVEGEDAVASQNADGNHGPMPESKGDLPAPPPPAPPATPPAPPPPGAPAPLRSPNAESFKKMIASEQVYTVTTVKAGAATAWGSSAANPLSVTAFVDNAGALPAQAQRNQLFTQMSRTEIAAIDYNNPPKLSLVNAAGAPVQITGMISLWIVCNEDTGDAVYLHSGVNSGPFLHGNAAIPANVNGVASRCAAFPVQSLNYQAGGTYDHTDGNNAANFVHLRVNTVNTNGVVTPR